MELFYNFLENWLLPIEGCTLDLLCYQRPNLKKNIVYGTLSRS
jgi:hypothetical protein